MKSICHTLAVFALTTALCMAADLPSETKPAVDKPAVAKDQAPVPEKPVGADVQKSKHDLAAFTKLDTNSDKMLSLEEFRLSKKDPAKAAGHFKTLDKDANGSLSLEEFESSPKSEKKKGKI